MLDPRLMGGCCARRAASIDDTDEELEREIAHRWARLIITLRRIRRQQRYFAFLGRRLQEYPAELRQRVKRGDWGAALDFELR